VPPIFAVSGKLAYEAKRATPFAADRLKASGFARSRISFPRASASRPRAASALETWRNQAASALRAVEDRIEEQTRGINSQNRFMDDVGREIDDMRETFVTRLPRHLAGVAEVFETEAVWVTKHLRRGSAPSRRSCGCLPATAPARKWRPPLSNACKTAVEAVAEKDGAEVVEACRDHWDDLGARVREAMGVDLKAAEPIEETLANAKNRFVTRLGRAARQGIGNLKVRNQLDKELRRRNIALRSFIFMTLCSPPPEPPAARSACHGLPPSSADSRRCF
jgi:hypothetical protein